jgi:CheY-like chemotaxis protein
MATSSVIGPARAAVIVVLEGLDTLHLSLAQRDGMVRPQHNRHDPPLSVHAAIAFSTLFGNAIVAAMTNTTDSHIPTIVYVEDNAGDAVLLEEALRFRGYATELQVINNGRNALHYFEVKERAKDVPPPHCILLDAFLPFVTGAELLRFIRSSRVYDDTPVYIFAPNTGEYNALLKDNAVSKESFINKANSWDELLQLADLLMRSATAKHDNTPANPTDSKPEVPAHGPLRREGDKGKG